MVVNWFAVHGVPFAVYGCAADSQVSPIGPIRENLHGALG
jgi:hypothetical protein